MNFKLIQQAGFAILLTITLLLGTIIYHQGRETRKLATTLVEKHLPAQEGLALIEEHLDRAFEMFHHYSLQPRITSDEVVRAMDLLDAAGEENMEEPDLSKARHLVGGLRATFEEYLEKEAESPEESGRLVAAEERYSTILNDYRLFLIATGRKGRGQERATDRHAMGRISRFLQAVEVTFTNYRTRERGDLDAIAALVSEALDAVNMLADPGWSPKQAEKIDKLKELISNYRSALVTYKMDQMIDTSETTLETVRQLEKAMSAKESAATIVFAELNRELRHDILSEQSALADSQKYNMAVFIMIAALGFVASLLVSLGMNRYISDRVRHLVRGTRILSKGHLSYRFPPTKDDLGILGEAFNEMADQIKAQRKGLELKVSQLDRAYSEIRSSRDSLESRVVQRTNDLKEAMDREARSNRSKTRFLRGLGHELSNHLQAIAIMMDMLRLSEAGDNQGETLELGGKALRRMERFIDDLRIVTQAEEGRLNFSPASLSPGGTVHRVVTELNVGGYGERLILRGDSARAEDSRVSGDERYFAQALRGTLVKVLCESRGEPVDVEWSMSAPSKGVIGFCADIIFGVTGQFEGQQDRFFEPFQVSEGDQNHQAATGMEMMVSQYIFAAMGGEADLFCTPGERPLLRIEVPFTLDTGAAGGEKQEKGDLGSDNPPEAAEITGCRILLAEDNMINEKLARAVLEILGCHVTVTRNGREAVEEVEREHYDLVLMDCEMPVMNGYEATAEIRRREAAPPPSGDSGSGRPIPIVALTGNAMLGDRERCQQAGMNDYISKPFSISALSKIIKKHVSGNVSFSPEAEKNSQSA